jgi:hypothetical protein
MGYATRNLATTLLFAYIAKSYAAAVDVQERQLCLIPPNRVTACGTADLTKANWDRFDIDTTLLGFINTFGVGGYCAKATSLS